ncbi:MULTISPECIES: DUF4340 domain-containing protein [unclassified Oceanispirochaeta]|uniref:DUF4340 domain-containing protein n=1 Tax=unclassified Oceanispirochaeta TaxID=2635722 RepID=UPI001314004A|nr:MULTISPECIES: DUF4340 domain-containing protein [unclassified Oceanispirochaeta]MBF9014490.1 DUF4340 domain-containing protein [Oceanispirochaeta sp. M2]NPD70746.1 DUF4340 domain-containing protein [Oceanispirochaeta sp. M1]
MNYRKGIFINLILFIVLAVLTGIVYLPEKKSVSETVVQEIELVGLNVSEIAAVAVINDAARFGLIHREGHISLEPGVEGMSYSVEAMQSFLFRISKLKAVSSIEKSLDDTVYGFETPRAVITLILSSGNKKRLILGEPISLDGSSYLRIEDPAASDDTVYLLSSEDTELFLSEPIIFSSDFIMPRVELKELDTLKSIELDFRGADFPSFSIENNGGFLFTLSEPIVSTLDYERTLKELIFPILSLSSVRTESLFPEPLLKEDEILSLNISLNEDEMYTLSLFRHEGKIFAGTEKGRAIAELSEEDLPFLDLHYLDLLNGSVYHCNVSEIESVVIEDSLEGEDYNITLSGESVNIQALINGVSVEYPQVMEFFDVLTKTGIARELPGSGGSDFQKQKTVFSILIYKKTGGMDRLEFVPSENNELALYVNGTAYFSTYYKTVLDIRKSLSELILKEGA